MQVIEHLATSYGCQPARTVYVTLTSLRLVKVNVWMD